MARSLILPHRDCAQFGSSVARARVLARAHHHQQPGVTAAAQEAVAAGGGDKDRAVNGEQQAVRAILPEHDLHAPWVLRHQERMVPQRRGREGPHGELAAPGVSTSLSQGHVQAAVPTHILQPRLVKQAPYRQAHSHGEAFLRLSRPDLTWVVIQYRCIPQLDAPDLAIVRGLGHQAPLSGDPPRMLELVALKSALQQPRLPPPRAREVVPVGTLGRREPVVPLLNLPKGGGGTAVGMGGSAAFAGPTSMPA